MTTRVLLRCAAVATLLTTIGHLTGSPYLLGSLWTRQNAMQSYRLDAMGFETSVFDFYTGFGWQVGAYLLGQAVVLWFLADVAPAKLRLLIGVFFLEFLAATVLALLTWRSFWIPAAANALPAALLAAAWNASRR